MPCEEEWKRTFAEGRIHDGLATYLAREDADPAISEALSAMTDIRRALRAKAWHGALHRAGSVADAFSGVQRDELARQISILENAYAARRKEGRDVALDLLSRVTHPALLAERENQRGVVHLESGALDAAEQCFDRAMALDPHHYRAITNRASISLDAGRTDEAIDLYQRALDIEREYPVARENLAIAYRRKGEIGLSVRELKKSRAMSAREPSTGFRGGMGQRAGSRRHLLYGILLVLVLVILLWVRAGG